ncbi:site-specific integrase [Sphingomonas paeninsulae]|uniref:Site-specific integrase n=1 Tax=Sphingomonas paeninsulae TaxID=2319844 RepID=A0A494TJD8_SPHPE|nr:tyrosine-type recombinase/integrase [Sphingomonas paeninsulae]AYJ87624.1 site-specific integrase [Sphingomonas paeninsulae]
MGAIGQSEGIQVPNIYPRNGIWWARFKVQGTEYRFSLLTRVRALAERRLKAERARIENEACFGIIAPQSWQSAVVAWNEHGVENLSASTFKRYLVSLAQLRTFLDDKTLNDINPELLRTIRKARLRVCTVATLKRDLTALSSVLDYAMSENWIDSNPTLAFRTARILQEKRDPICLPERDSMRMLEKAAPDRFRDACEFALISGLRQAELFGLKHSQLDPLDESVTIVGKRNKMRVIPYTRQMKAIVARQAQFIGKPWVFWHGTGERWGSPASRFGDIKRRVAQKASQSKTDFEPYRFHDYRHLYAVTYLREGRGSIYTLQGLLGHDSIKTTELYLEFLTPAQKLKAMHGVTQSGAQEQRSATKRGIKNG